MTERPFGIAQIMDIHDAAWSELMGREDPFPTDTGRPYWRPSSLGYCMRRQYLWRHGVEETRQDDAADRERKFAWGRDIENHVRERIFRAGLLIESGVEVLDENLSVRGQIDLVWGGLPSSDLPARADRWSAPYKWAVQTIRERVANTIVTSEHSPLPITGTEIKSTHGATVSKMVKEGPRFDHRVQAGIYFALAQFHPEQFIVPLERFEIVVIGRDAVRPIQFEATEVEVELALTRLDALNTAWAERKAPDCTCGQTEGMGWEKKFCPYSDADGECCGTTLLDLLAASVSPGGQGNGEIAAREVRPEQDPSSAPGAVPSGEQGQMELPAEEIQLT